MQVNVALVQQKARIFPNEDSFKERIFHFMQRARATGILAEAPSLNEEAFLVAKWDFTRLVELMAKTDLQVSRDRRLDIIKKYYQSL